MVFLKMLFPICHCKILKPSGTFAQKCLNFKGNFLLRSELIGYQSGHYFKLGQQLLTLQLQKNMYDTPGQDKITHSQQMEAIHHLQ